MRHVVSPKDAGVNRGKIGGDKGGAAAGGGDLVLW
jgi:hypothetical protein